MKSIIISLIFLFSINSHRVKCQNSEDYNIIKLIPTTEIKDQGNSGTCWSFGTISFLESEVLRMKNISIDLSEMYVVRFVYPEKAKNFFRTQGNLYFTAGGQPHDVLNSISTHGLVPEATYPQNLDLTNCYDTEKLDTLATQFVSSYRKNEDDIISLDWTSEFDELLNKYLGIPPSNFSYNNQKYTPLSFCSEYLSIDANNYIQITSFNHHPYNEPFCLESRYNWALEQYFNVELKKFMEIIEKAIMNGYSVVFNGDVSEEGFDFYGSEKAVIENTKISRKEESHVRQELFEQGASTIDHVMHIVGIAKGNDGKKYFITKNSWGTSKFWSGYIYISEDYIKYKAISILVHKDALKFE